jgi:hypothetical protein
VKGTIRIVPFGGGVPFRRIGEVSHEWLSRNQIVDIASGITFQRSNDLRIIPSAEWLEKNMNVIKYHRVAKELQLLQLAGKVEVFDKHLGEVRHAEIGVSIVGYRGYEVLGPFDIVALLECTAMNSPEGHNNLPKGVSLALSTIPLQPASLSPKTLSEG